MKFVIACLFKVDIIGKLHVLGVNSEDLEASRRVGDPDINFPIEATETAKSGINRVWSVGSGHNNHIRPSFEAIHER